MRRALLFFALTLLFAVPAASAWEIEKFHADLLVEPDGSLIVTERIEVDFQGEDRHGIYRDIPTATQNRLGVHQSIRLTFIEATDENDRRWGARLSREGAYQRIRLGSANVTYQGRKSFNITYRVDRAIQTFPDHDELYWNVTGNGWAVPIRDASAVLRLPNHSEPSGGLLATAYTGGYGSRLSEARVETEGNDTFHYTVTRSLGAFEGLTIVAGWPRGLVSTPGRIRSAVWLLGDNWPFGIPILTFFGMFLLWWKLGRDPKHGPVTVQYDPPEGFTPAEVGALIDDDADIQDITATVIDLARRGYLSIDQISKDDYLFKPNHLPESPARPALKPHEAKIFVGIFREGKPRKLSDMENGFYKNLETIKKSIYETLVKAGCWRRNPEEVRTLWMGAAVAVFVLMFIYSTVKDDFSFFSLIPSLTWPLVLSAGVIAGFAVAMPRKTLWGMKILEQILGLEEFIRRVDEDRLRREKDLTALFEKILPYAMVLGMAKEWGRAFEGIYRTAPVWYQSYDGGSFSSRDFSTRMQNTSSRMGTVFASAPRSSGGSGFGGGFSGGGGGGGGGGGW